MALNAGGGLGPSPWGLLHGLGLEQRRRADADAGAGAVGGPRPRRSIGSQLVAPVVLAAVLVLASFLVAAVVFGLL